MNVTSAGQIILFYSMSVSVVKDDLRAEKGCAVEVLSAQR